MNEGWWWCDYCDYPNDNWWGACWHCGKEYDEKIEEQKEEINDDK